MFSDTADTFHAKQIISQKKFIETFITKKGQWKKILTKLFLVWHITDSPHATVKG